MAGSLKERVTERIAQLREERPAVDHVVRMQEHYGKTNASQQAGAATYFGFLSFFPIMALAFFLVGYIAKVYPGAQGDLVDAIDSMLPGIIGSGDGQIQLADIQDAAGTVGLVGVVGVLYAGLGWLSALREALITVFELPSREQPNFVMGKLRDLVTLAIIGTVLLVSVAFTGLVSGFSDSLLEALGFSTSLDWLVGVLAIALGLVANTVLFFALFRLLAAPDLPRRAMLSGALLGAVGFEVLKQISGLLIRSTQGQPAFQVFGLALILLVWINYFSRVVLYAAAWAWTDPQAREQRVLQPADPVQGPASPSVDEHPALQGDDTSTTKKGALAAGAVLGAAAAAGAAVIKNRGDHES